LDHFGECEIICCNSGEKAVLDFSKCGWLERGRYEVKGCVLDQQGNVRTLLTGKWNHSIRAHRLTEATVPACSKGCRSQDMPAQEVVRNVFKSAGKCRIDNEMQGEILWQCSAYNILGNVCSHNLGGRAMI
jgi:hypothetical protein